MEPLAERLRPRRLEDYIGQEHLVGEGAVLRRMIDSGRIASAGDTILYAVGCDEWCEGCT